MNIDMDMDIGNVMNIGSDMDIDMIALDLDGTLLERDHASVTARSVQVIDEAHRRGIVVAIASGRIYSFLPPAARSITAITWAITSNGAVLYDQHSHTTAGGTYISPTSTRALLGRLPRDVWAEVWSKGKIYVERRQWDRMREYPLAPLHVTVLDQIGEPTDDILTLAGSEDTRVEKINLPIAPATVKLDLMRLPSADMRYSFIDTGSGLEISGPKVSKAQGIRRLCAAMSISMRNVLAIGDSENDIDMLRDCGVGVAMGNAIKPVKAVADAITLSNHEDGVALAIERYALRV